MADEISLTSTIAGRYATALFDLAKEAGDLDRVDADVSALRQAISESEDFQRLIASPLYGREAQSRAISAIVDKMEIGQEVGNLAKLMASKRRLFALPDVAEGFQSLLADERGEVTADVTAARFLSDGQIDALKGQLHDALGRDVKLNILIDPAIIGGLIVKVGSRMIDTSIRSKLAALKTAMREAG